MNDLAKRQRGIVLILSLIMLVVLTLLAVSAIRLSTVNLRTVANAQTRSEAMSAAQRTIDCVLSSNFADSVVSVAGIVTGPCAHPAGSPIVEGGKNYTVVIATPCLARSAPVLNTALPSPEPAPPGKQCGPYPVCTCRKGGTTYSQCSETIWQIRATSSSGWFGATVSITQGTGIRMDNGKLTAYLNDPSIPRCTGT